MDQQSSTNYFLYLFLLSLGSLIYLLAEASVGVAIQHSSLRLAQLIFFLVSCLATFVVYQRVSLRSDSDISQRLSWIRDNPATYWLLVCLVAAGTFIGLSAILSIWRGSPLAWLPAPVTNLVHPLLLWNTGFAWLSLLLLGRIGDHHTQSLLDRLLTIRVEHWVFLAFLLSFTLVYFRIFLLETGFLDFPEPVSNSEPIGDDLRKYLGYSESTLIDGVYRGNYPPFPLFFFYPLLFVDFYDAYHLVTLLTLASFLFSSLVFPVLVSRGWRMFSLLVIFVTTGLFSYGLHWELENGQFNLIAFAFTLTALWLYHRKPSWRLLAYALFSVGVQLKLWPGIFIFMLVDDWSDAPANLRRFLLLSATNLAGFFVLGAGVFAQFLDNLASTRGDYLWVGNHSVESFVHMLTQNAAITATASAWLQAILYVLVLGLIIYCLYVAWKRNETSFNPHLFLALCLGALLIPPISNDYKLPILVAPMLIFVASGSRPHSRMGQSIYLALILLLCLTYFLTLYSIGLKPPALGNNFPALFSLLALTTASYAFLGRKALS